MLRILDFILKASGSHGGVLSRGEAGSTLSIRNILLGPSGVTLGGVGWGKNGNWKAREEAGIEGGLTWLWDWKRGWILKTFRKKEKQDLLIG